VTCDLAGETFDGPGDLIYLTYNNGMAVNLKAFVGQLTMVPHLKTTTPIRKCNKKKKEEDIMKAIMTDRGTWLEDNLEPLEK
jgi:hypothetical protein